MRVGAERAATGSGFKRSVQLEKACRHATCPWGNNGGQANWRRGRQVMRVGGSRGKHMVGEVLPGLDAPAAAANGGKQNGRRGGAGAGVAEATRKGGPARCTWGGGRQRLEPGACRGTG
jgi:hypothetical protein